MKTHNRHFLRFSNSRQFRHTFASSLFELVRKGWVESRTGAVRDLLAVARFPSPLIKPDVRIARIRLSE